MFIPREGPIWWLHCICCFLEDVYRLYKYGDPDGPPEEAPDTPYSAVYW